MKAFLVCVLLTMAIVGCEQEKSVPILDEQNASVDVVPTYDRSAFPEEIVLTESGLFGYWEGSTFSIDSVRALLTGFDVVAGSDSSEGQTWDVIFVKKGQSKLLQIDSDFLEQVGKVSTSSPLVGIDTRHRVGMMFPEVFPQGQDASCYPGVEELTGEVICAAPERNQLFYMFSGAWDGPDSRLPPLDVLQELKITSIFWTSK